MNGAKNQTHIYNNMLIYHLTNKRLVANAKGFALIATISVMVLLVMVALAMLSLSTIELRSSGKQMAQDEARANARMALMLAIGDLQKNLGPDRAVTARASMVHPNTRRPNTLGVWKSWRWEPRLGGAPDYSEKRQAFQQWLVSGRDQSMLENASMPKSDISGALGDSWQWLINPDTTGVLSRSPRSLYSEPGVKAELVQVVNSSGSEQGRYGWAVMDQSMGASLALNRKHQPGSAVGQRIAHRVAPSRVRSDLLSNNLSGLDHQHQAWTMGNAVFLTGSAGRDEIMGRWHDLTEGSLGLLCDVTRGRLKVDLSNIFESSGSASQMLSDVEGTNVPDEMYFSGNGAPRWSWLRNHYRLYKRVTNVGDKWPRITLNSEDTKPFNGLTEYEKFADSPETPRLLPVISKLQMVFSLVAHEEHIGSRVAFYNTNGVPRGNHHYAVPKIGYDPVVTLYNPYDVELRLPHLRVRIWDPPVVFRFKKNGVYVRPDFQRGDFHGLARFQIVNELNPFARKYFNLILSDGGSNGQPGNPIVLQPGEVKVFSPYIENEWTWGFETRDQWRPRSFFDWNVHSGFGLKDNRPLGPLGQFGLHCVPGWNARAGLVTDHLSYGNGGARPQASKYNWEGSFARGPVLVQKKHTFTVEAKPGKAPRPANQPDFIVEILAGQNVDAIQNGGRVENKDLLRRFEFKFADVVQELSETPDDPVIERTFEVGDIYQSDDDQSPGGKTPFGILTMTAKTTVDDENSTKPWLYNNPVVEGEKQQATSVGMIHHSYDLQFREMSSFTDFPGVEIDPNTKRGFYGASATASQGVSNVPANRVPMGPASSLGEFIHSNVVAGRTLPRVTHALGNSRAHPMLDSHSVTNSGGQVSFAHHLMDHSYLLNDVLWDRYFFSSIVDQTAEYAGQSRSRTKVLSDLLKGEQSTLNTRLIASPHYEDSDKVAADVFQSNVSAARGLAGKLMVKGMFNVNSDSVDAWRAMLMSLRDEAILGWQNRSHEMYGRTGFPRMGLPLGGDPAVGNQAPPDVAGAIRWAGFRSLSDDDIKKLSESIVIELRKRGDADDAPFQSLGEFANRRVGNGTGLHALAGILQTAISESGINQFNADDSKLVMLNQIKAMDKVGTKNMHVLAGQSAEGAPVAITQGDLLGPLASVISVRGDTFKVRAYGDARNHDGRIVARAWCEATLQRLPDYLDPTDSPDISFNQLGSIVNQRFGRRFVMVSFRWLSPDEV